MKRLVIGLTGGIGSGKTTVANLFAEKGVTVIDTDQLARDVIQPDSDAFKQVQKKFGDGILSENGTLNRAKLRKIVFDDPEHRLWLENLLHPLIRKEMEKQVAASQSPYCIVIIPLLLESKPNPLINRILIVDASIENQLLRTQARDNVSAAEAHAILNTQVTREHRLEKAHDIIYNDGILSDLTPQVEKLHGFYLSL